METLTFQTERSTKLLDITELVRRTVEGKDGRAVILFVPHTTAGIVIQASGRGASRVAADVELAMEQLISEEWNYEHAHEGSQPVGACARRAYGFLSEGPARGRAAWSLRAAGDLLLRVRRAT